MQPSWRRVSKLRKLEWEQTETFIVSFLSLAITVIVLMIFIFTLASIGSEQGGSVVASIVLGVMWVPFAYLAWRCFSRFIQVSGEITDIEFEETPANGQNATNNGNVSV